jgi:hypothetical protein
LNHQDVALGTGQSLIECINRLIQFEKLLGQQGSGQRIALDEGKIRHQWLGISDLLDSLKQPFLVSRIVTVGELAV